ncbi:unnamed protein product [Closterium sp. NIES-65]|nr:unnamed protein product [Closterium sp. NIES-65]
MIFPHSLPRTPPSPTHLHRDFSYNYLTGFLPSTITKIKSRSIQNNSLVGSLPSSTWTACTCHNNCLSSIGTYTSNSQRATCSICGSTVGTGTLCGPGQACEPDEDYRIPHQMQNIEHSWPFVLSHSRTLSLLYPRILALLRFLSLTLSHSFFPLYLPWALPLLHILTADAMMALKAALGVTRTTWASTNLCRLTGISSPLQNEWTSVFCNLASSVESIGLFCNYRTGTMPIPSTSLVSLDVGLNFLSGSFPQLSLAVCAAEQNCFLNSSYCRTYGVQQRPTSACVICGTTNRQGVLCGGALCYPFSLGVVNVPSLPPVAMTSLRTSLLSLAIQDNFLAGSFLAASLTRCDASSNCLASAMACSEESAVAQRDAEGCAICESEDGHGLLCFGGLCLPDVDGSTVHADDMDPPRMTCAVQALLAVKSALGVNFTTWGVGKSCTTASAGPAIAGTLTAVSCNSFGKVCIFDLSGNLFQGCLDEFTTHLRLLTALQSMCVALCSCMPSFLSLNCPSTPSLTSPDVIPFTSHSSHLRAANPHPPLNHANSQNRPPVPPPTSLLGFNYLTGSLLGSIAAPLKALDVQFNFLAVSFPALGLAFSSARINCFASTANCKHPTRPAEIPRAAATCAICNTVGFNFLAGSFPALGLAFSSTRINCFASTANCKHPTRPAEIPRAAAACAICNTTNAKGKLCSNIIGGGICSVTPPSALLLPPGTPNSALSPVLPLVCTAAASVARDATQAAALMNVKVALGVSFADWRGDALCTLMGSPVAPGSQLEQDEGSWRQVGGVGKEGKKPPGCKSARKGFKLYRAD